MSYIYIYNTYTYVICLTLKNDCLKLNKIRNILVCDVYAHLSLESLRETFSVVDIPRDGMSKYSKGAVIY